MNSIFDTNELYPDYDDILKEYFKNHFDSVYVCFLPFFKINNRNSPVDIRLSKAISLEEAKTKHEIYNKLDPNVNRVIYSYDNSNYPAREDIIAFAEPLKWKDILYNSGFENYNELNLALRTSIGALRSEYERKDLQEKLDEFTTTNRIFHPVEGRISVLSLLSIYKCLTDLGKTKLVITDEFFQDRKTIDLLELNATDFVLQLHGYMYYFPEDRSLLFTIEWDSFFYLICGAQDLLEKIIPQYGFEGFYSNSETTHNWYLPL